MPKLPIFYDIHQNRWSKSRRSLRISIGLFFLACIIFTVSVVIRPIMPFLNLSQPENNVRGVNDSSSGEIADTTPRVLFDINAYAMQKKQSDGIVQSPSSKMLGFYVNWDENSLTSLEANIGNLDVLVPEWLHLGNNGTGSIVEDDTDRMNKTLSFIDSAKPDLKITPLVNNFNNESQEWDTKLLEEAVGTEESRQTLIHNLLVFVQSHNFSGVSIDFESVPKKDQDNLTLFMQSLYGEFHKNNLEVSQSIPLEDATFDAKKLGASADYLILMAYDEHSTDSTPAGPLTSQGWFVNAMEKRFKELPSEKYIVAIGGYGYDWIEDTTKGKVTTFGEILHTAANAKATVFLDPQSLNPTYSYYDNDNVLHHAWYLDAVATFNQMQTMKQLGRPYGYALWRMGSEDPSMWNIVGHRDNLNAEDASLLNSIKLTYDVGYEGDGEVLRVKNKPIDGTREITYDDTSGLITNESVTSFPLPYVVTRFGGTENNKVVLTFDDGPDEKYTPQILDILKKYNIPATFFIMGINASTHPDILQRIVEEGHELGNHTYTHPDVTVISAEQLRIELDATERLIEGVVGRKSLLFRPPYAEDIEPTTPDQIAPLAISSDLGYYTVGINIDPTDWNRPGTDAIVNTVVNQRIEGVGNVILMHDSGGDRSQTVEALPQIIESLQNAGYQFASVSDILGISKDEIMPPVSAYEKAVSYSNKVAVFFLFLFTRFLAMMFLIGIVLGFARFIFIAVLAIVQTVTAKKNLPLVSVDEFQPYVAVIVPAYNEEKVINKTIVSLLDSTYPRLRIIIVDDGSTDKTLEVVQAAFGDNKKVTIFTKKNAGKSHALNFGITKTWKKEEFIVTLDADTIFQKGTIAKLVHRFSDATVGAVAGNAKVGNRVNILTKWQALEYITSQNLDRRAFEMLNCISVVPGSVGAWRKDAVTEVGGFSDDTLAEDADLTFSILRKGYRVVYADKAFAFTEAPDTVRNFVNQRYRWMFGTMQTAWKHKDILFRKKYGALGYFSIPNIFVFQVFFTLISPFMDLALILSILWAVWQKYQHPVGYEILQSMHGTLMYYLIFLVVDMATALLPFLIERKEQWRLLIYLPLQRFCYRQLMYYVAIRATRSAIRGRFVRWGSIERKATTKLGMLHEDK